MDARRAAVRRGAALSLWPRGALCAAVISSLLAAAYAGPPIGDSESADAIQVRDARFVKGGRIFHFAGFNQYYMMEKARSNETLHLVDDVLRDASELGMTVLRTWAFDDRPFGLQRAPGEFDEETFRGLDYVLDQSGKRGIHVLLSLVNYWSDYGGMRTYVKWCSSRNETNQSVTEFYRNPVCRQMYKNAAQTILGRRNTLNGRLYKDDPTILGFDLANEPRNPGDPSGNTVSEWVSEMAAFVKLLAPNRLVTTGMEGFYGLSTPTLALHDNPGGGDAGSWPYYVCEGTDFVRHHSIPQIDFTVAHLYADQWVDAACGGIEYCKKLFAAKWVDSHIEQSSLVRKPFVLEEFGASVNMNDSYAKLMRHREDIFETVYGEIEHAAALNDIGTGSLFWVLSSNEYYDYDGFTLYNGRFEGEVPVEPTPPPGEEGLDSVLSGLERAKNYVKRKKEKLFRNAQRRETCVEFLRKAHKSGELVSKYRESNLGSVFAADTGPSAGYPAEDRADTIGIVTRAAQRLKDLAFSEALPVGAGGLERAGG